MNDKRLLELVAISAFGNMSVQMLDSGWNPLIDDGDALRLAVKLRIGLGDRETTVTAFHNHSMATGSVYVEEIGDKYEATRRAIVRAAVGILGSPE